MKMDHCDLFLSDHIDVGESTCADVAHRTALARRAEGAPSWSPVVRRADGEGWRDHLDGQPIHCGDRLELQGIEYRSNDYGEYTLKTATGALVGYELTWGTEGAVPMLHSSVVGHEFMTRLEPWMRFRWPPPRELNVRGSMTSKPITSLKALPFPPADATTQVYAFMGRRGSGKTFAAGRRSSSCWTPITNNLIDKGRGGYTINPVLAL